MIKNIMRKKIKVLRIIGTIDPARGGPSKTVIESSIVLNRKGFKVDILTANKKGSNFFKSKEIRVINKGSMLNNEYGLSLSLFLWLLRNRNEYDYFIIHGVWRFYTLAARILLKKKYYVFIHGQLDPFFSEDFFKRILKQIYWVCFEKKNLLCANSILLTSEGEKQSLKKTFVNTDGIKKTILRYGIIKPKINKKLILKKFYKKFPNFKNKNFYLFLGRFHEKKGCEILIESVKKMGKHFKSSILLAGPMTGAPYEKKIKNLIQKYKLQEKIILSDMLSGDLKWGSIQASKAMVLSSHGENFGISLAESLCLGKPVLTTDKVNIFKEILNFNAGYVAKNRIDSFIKILKKYDNLNKTELKKLSNNSINCFNKNFDLSVNKNSLYNLLIKNIKVR
jgi:glycosyltransferase involved in cell wall biosynthesis